MKYIPLNCALIVLLTMSVISCVKDREAINATSEFTRSPVGYWVTENETLGVIGWEITLKSFKKCVIAFDSKITEKTGNVEINQNKVNYNYHGSVEKFSATYNVDDMTLTDDQIPNLKYVRASNKKIEELNAKGCHL